jgi:FixJ family two-component response regulator
MRCGTCKSIQAAVRWQMVSLQTHGLNSSFVAIVDDDDLMRGALQGLLKEAGFISRAFASAEEFLSADDHMQAACLIADIRLPGMSGLYLQAQLNAEQARIPTIFVTAHADARLRIQALPAASVSSRSVFVS